MKTIFCGDPHVVWSELDDCWRLIDAIEAFQAQYDADTLCILGDLFHTHQTVDLEVQQFWREALARLRPQFRDLVVLSGNHDQPNNRVSKANALHALTDLECYLAVEEPAGIELWEYCPYTADEKQLVKWASSLRPGGQTAKYIACHQTFQGAVFENGVAAHDWFDQSKLPQKLIISGHIHTPMDIPGINGGPRVVYPGAPRWRTVSDANTTRALLGFDDSTETFTRFNTGDFCTPIYHFEDSESSPLAFTPKPNARYVIDIKGSTAWVNERKGLYAGHRVRTFPVAKAVSVKESEGIDKALSGWFESFSPPFGTPKAILMERASKWLTPPNNKSRSSAS